MRLDRTTPAGVDPDLGSRLDRTTPAGVDPDLGSRLDRATPAGVDPDLGSRREPGGRPAEPLRHGERVTISAEARAANRDRAPAVRGEVRWYRAARYGHAWGPVASGADGADDARLPPTKERAIQSPRLAVDAYVRAMRSAA